LRRLFFDPAKVTSDRVERYARMLNLPGSFRALVAIARQIIPKDPDSIAARLADIRVPALLIWGDHDEIVPLSQAELMQERMPNSRLVIIDRCRHMPAEEYPEETARVILSFLAGLSAGSPPPPCG
jgi:pimeloyl-ACP methyl ester carboxylesterase